MTSLTEVLRELTEAVSAGAGSNLSEWVLVAITVVYVIATIFI